MIERGQLLRGIYPEEGKHGTAPVRTIFKEIDRPFADTLPRQVDGFVDRVATRLVFRGHIEEGEGEKYSGFLKHYMKKALKERDKRSDEVQSAQVKEAESIIRKLLPHEPFDVYCTDGRIVRPLVFGFLPGVGGTLRLAAARIPGFREDPQAGELMLEGNSYFAGLIGRYYDSHPDSSVMLQIVDSHLDCAARGGKEAKKGRGIDGGGLLKAVKKKKKRVNAMKKYAESLPGGKSIMGIQFSFNPHNGFGYMGLETDTSLADATKKRGFTPVVLASLVDKGQVVATEEVSKELESAFSAHTFAVDWQEGYSDTALKFWKGIEALNQDAQVAKVIEQKIKAIYPDIDAEELQTRRVLILANSYSGFLLNSLPGGYPFGSHTESCVVIEERSNGPFNETMKFLLHPRSEKLADDIVLAQGIVRDNRAQERIKDITGVYMDDRDKFVAAPVPVIVQGIVKNPVEEEGWATLEKIDWDTLPLNWHKLEREIFEDWITSQSPDLPAVIMHTIERMRQMMIELERNEESYEFAEDGSIALVPLLVDRNRKPRAIVPFN